jgi:hypothetical protein
MKEITALELVQRIGASTMFTDCNKGMSLPLDVSKKIARIAVKALFYLPKEKWELLSNEIEKL